MPLPTFHINISGSVIAAYGAVVATIVGAVQIINFLRDRTKIKLSVHHNMRVWGDPRYTRKDALTSLTVANAGRRPVTITTVGAFRLHPHDPFVFGDVRPPLPRDLAEGKHLTALADLTEIDITTIEHWEAYDAVGHKYRLPVAPWGARLISRIRQAGVETQGKSCAGRIIYEIVRS